MKKPPMWVLNRIKKLRVDTVRGKVYRGGVEIGGPYNRKKITFKKGNTQINCYRYHVIWFVRTGKWPSKELHHKNEITWDDRFSNLDEVTHSMNCLLSKRSRLPTGIDLNQGRYRVRLFANNKRYWIGSSKTLEDAVRIRRRALYDRRH